MTDTNSVDTATRRLALALDALDAAVERRRAADRNGEGFAEQLHALGADRSRLAADLDAAIARSRALENANREIAQRLDTAIGNVRSVLEENAVD